ncbi:MAG: AraC-like DNA-binding protein, partial [bacterium]
MTYPLTNSSGITKALFDAIVLKGINPKKLEKETGLQPQELENPEGRIPTQKHVQLWKVGVKLTKDPALALHLAEEEKVEDIGIVGLMALNSATLKEAIKHVIRYLRLVCDSDSVEIKEEGDLIYYTYQITTPEFHTIYGIERALASTVLWSRSLTQSGCNPVEVYFQHSKPEYVDVYKRIFQAPIIFDHPENKIIFHIKHFDLPLPSSQKYLLDILKKHAETLLQNLEHENQFQDRVLKLIYENISTVDSTMVSEKINISTRTLNRRLKEEGTSFKTLHDDARKNFAINFLKDRKLPIFEVAFLTGFSETSSFNRAFKRWMSKSPKAYRESLIS